MYEITYPDYFQLMINNNLVARLEPLKKNNSIKKRKDVILLIKNLSNFNFIEIIENQPTDMHNYNLDLRVDYQSEHLMCIVVTKTNTNYVQLLTDNNNIITY